MLKKLTVFALAVFLGFSWGNINAAQVPLTTSEPRMKIHHCEKLRIGHYLSDSYTVLSRKIEPFIHELESNLTSLHKCYNLQLVILPTYKMGQLAILNDQVDIMRLGVADRKSVV